MSARSRDLKPAVFVPVNQNVGQAVFKDESKERVTGGSMRPSVFVAVLHVQPVGLCRRFEFLIMVGVSPATILYAVFVVEIVYHLMEQGCRYFLDGPRQRSRADVDFMRPAQLGNPGIIPQGEMTVCAGRGLDGDGGP